MAKKKAQPIPELAEEQVVLASLKKHPRNYKKHTDAQLEHIAHNIKREGVWKNVVVSKDGYTLAGHGVVEAAIRAGLTRAPARRIPVAHTHPRALAIVVADNETSRLAENDDMMLAALLGSIQEADGLLGTGYDDDALTALAANAAGAAPPSAFPSIDNPEVDHECPKCGYQWSGSTAPRTEKPAKSNGAGKAKRARAD